MKYEITQRLKTKTKILAETDTLIGAIAWIRRQNDGYVYKGTTYVGVFPNYVNGKKDLIIVPRHEPTGLVCSPTDKELQKVGLR